MIFRVVVFYVLTWIFVILLGGSQQAVGLIPPEFGLAQWGPGIAALLTALIFRKDGHRFVFFSKKTPVLRYLLALLIPVGLGLIVFLAGSFIPREARASQDVSLALVAIWAPLGALGEEIGWRGYLHKRLDTRLRGVFSSLLVGALWFPIHVQFFAEGPLFVAILALLIISYSFVIYVLLQDTGFNILLATIFHLAINLSNLLYIDRLYEIKFMLLNALVWAAFAVLLVLFKRDLFLRPKEQVH